MDRYLIEMKNIFKVYESNRAVALDHACFRIAKGSIHALVGENGAGKSTLMKILCGSERKNDGEILINGIHKEIRSAQESYLNGIGMVNQRFRLVDNFTVAENVLLRVEKTGRWGFIDKRENQKTVEELMKASCLLLPPKAKVSGLTMGQRQLVEILRILNRSVDILVLDEPTSALTPQEIQRLFRFIQELRAQGKTIVFISHRLEEVFELCDSLTVLRSGRNIAEGPLSDFDKKQVSFLMVGENPGLPNSARTAKGHPVLMRVENVSIKDDQDKVEVVRSVTMEVCQYQITAIVGVSNNGKRELVEALAGLKPIASGEIFMRDQKLSGQDARGFRKAGIAYVPEDRAGEGASLSSSVLDNILATKYREPPYSKRVAGWKCRWINRKFARKSAEALVKEFQVKVSSLRASLETLSGGNIQKVILAREMSSDPAVLILCEPTWGLDYRSTAFVYRRLFEMREAGKAVLIVSSYLDEVLFLADRIFVIYKGEITASLENSATLTKAAIGERMLGLDNPLADTCQRNGDDASNREFRL